MLLNLAPGPDTLLQRASEFIQKRSYWAQITGCSVCRIKVEGLLQFQCTDRLSKILCHRGQEWNSWSERQENEIVNWGYANWREMFKFRYPFLKFPLTWWRIWAGIKWWWSRLYKAATPHRARLLGPTVLKSAKPLIPMKWKCKIKWIWYHVFVHTMLWYR